MRVLLEVAAFPAPDADALYRAVRAIDWTAHLAVSSTFAVSATVQGSASLRHSGFAALKVAGPTRACSWICPASRCTGAATGWRWWTRR
jgi:hypothetical protein